MFHLIEYDAVTAFFLVMRADLPQEMNDEDYFELEKAYFPTEYTDYTPISTNTIILDGREAIEHIWSFTQPTEIPNVVFTWKYLRLYTIDKKVVWCLEASSILFDNYKNTFDTMVSGFFILR